MRIMTRTRIAVAAAALASTLAFAGCTSTVPTLDPTPSDSSLQTTSLTPTPSESESAAPVDDPSDPDSWVIADDRMGPVVIGSDFDDTVEAIRGSGVGDMPGCDGVAYGTTSDNAYDIVVIDDTSANVGTVHEVSVNWNGDTADVGPRTAEGLGLGSTEDEVLSAYEDAHEEASAISGRSFVLVGAHLVFTFTDGIDGATKVSLVTDGEPAYEPCA